MVLFLQYMTFLLVFVMFCVIIYFKKYKKERYMWINNMKKCISWKKINKTPEEEETQKIIDEFEELN